MNKRSLSKFLSLVLRHKPEVIDIRLDKNGWCSVQELIDKCNKSGKAINEKILKEIVAEDEKGRYSFDDTGDKIRANQGHSLKVKLDLKEKMPPKFLYHGTVERFMESIMRSGLKRMNRQHVHLSGDLDTATKVGNRRGKAVILRLYAKKMSEDGHKFFISENGVWLIDGVPAKYLERLR